MLLVGDKRSISTRLKPVVRLWNTKDPVAELGSLRQLNGCRGETVGAGHPILPGCIQKRQHTREIETH